MVISGFSGAGKGTVTRRLISDYPDYALSVSATSRAPREGEKDGVHYFFKTREEFEALIKEDALIEYATYVNNYYGTPKAYVEDNLSRGKNVILEIEVQGALQIRRKYPEAVLLFLTAPSAGELQRRLLSRGTETPEVIASRMKRAVAEADSMPDYDYLIVNDDLDTCVCEVNSLVASCKKRTLLHKPFMNRMKAELAQLTQSTQ